MRECGTGGRCRPALEGDGGHRAVRQTRKTGWPRLGRWLRSGGWRLQNRCSLSRRKAAVAAVRSQRKEEDKPERETKAINIRYRLQERGHSARQGVDRPPQKIQKKHKTRGKKKTMGNTQGTGDRAGLQWRPGSGFGSGCIKQKSMQVHIKVRGQREGLLRKGDTPTQSGREGREGREGRKEGGREGGGGGFGFGFGGRS